MSAVVGVAAQILAMEAALNKFSERNDAHMGQVMAMASLIDAVQKLPKKSERKADWGRPQISEMSRQQRRRVFRKVAP